ncbi:MAG: KpsF/GutQ family sugar-phosphate isomerase [Thiotrichaceae bacterium]|nr:KpsF/GutQ family sugar-phosphate isomerase [Thiotrichaceae bacterium]
MPLETHFNYIAIARQVIALELAAIEQLNTRLNNSFTLACKLIIKAQGRLIITGMGKSGHIGKKMTATFASTGTPAYFVHPGEALHGDLGMILPNDVVIAISNSGSTEELIVLGSSIKRQGSKLIAMTSNSDSKLGTLSDVHLNIGVQEEACPLDLAPTSSTTVTLVLGDAMASALMTARDFTQEDFARSHPAGRLGKRLLLHIKDLMHTGDQLPIISPESSIQHAILEMTKKKLGATLICNEQSQLLGIFTDGDLRRAFEQQQFDKPIAEVIQTCRYTINAENLAMDGLSMMQDHEIMVLPVVEGDRLIGIIHMHDLLKAGIV